MSHAKNKPIINEERARVPYVCGLSRMVFWVGLIDLILFACCAVAAPLLWEKAVFIGFALPGAALLTAYCNLRIVLYRDTFSVRNFFRVTRTYSYAEITGIEQGYWADRLHMGRRHVEINILYKEYPAVLVFLAERYMSQSGGKRIPELPENVPYVCGLSRMVFWVGLIDLILFACCAVAAPLLWEKAEFIGFALLGAALLTAYCNLRIVLYRDTFSVRNFFRVTRTYGYAEITGIEQGYGAVRLYMGRRHVEINILYKEYPAVLKLLAGRYMSQSGGKGIPRLPEKNSRFDLFNGHVRGAGAITAVYAGTALMLVAVLIFMGVVCRRYETRQPENARVSFLSDRLSYDGDDLILHAAQDDWEYRIQSCRQTLSDVEGFLKACEAGTAFDVAFILIGPKEDKHRSLESIAADGTVYLDRRVMVEHLQKNMRLAMGFMGGLLLLWLGNCAASVAVGRHPERYSYRTLRLFFKDGALKPGCVEKTPRPKKH